MVRADCLFPCDIVVAMLVVIKRGFLFSFFRVFTTIEKGLQAVFISVPQNLMQSTYSTLSLSRPTISGSKRRAPARIVDITLTVLSFTGLRNVIKFDISHQFPFVNAFVSSCCDRYRLMYFKILFFQGCLRRSPKERYSIPHLLAHPYIDPHSHGKRSFLFFLPSLSPPQSLVKFNTSTSYRTLGQSVKLHTSFGTRPTSCLSLVRKYAGSMTQFACIGHGCTFLHARTYKQDHFPCKACCIAFHLHVFLVLRSPGG